MANTCRMPVLSLFIAQTLGVPAFELPIACPCEPLPRRPWSASVRLTHARRARTPLSDVSTDTAEAPVFYSSREEQEAALATAAKDGDWKAALALLDKLSDSSSGTRQFVSPRCFDYVIKACARAKPAQVAQAPRSSKSSTRHFSRYLAVHENECCAHVIQLLTRYRLIFFCITPS